MGVFRQVEGQPQSREESSARLGLQSQRRVRTASEERNVFRSADKMLVLKNGRVELFGPGDQVMARLMQPAQAIPPAAAEAKG